VGKKVWVRGGIDRVLIFFEGELIKTHLRAKRAGTWMTDENDYPPEKSKYLLRTTAYYTDQAGKYGEYVEKMVGRVMSEHAYRNLRKVQAIFRLGEKYGAEALNLSCQRCLFFGDLRITTIKRILKERLYHLPCEEERVKKARVLSAEGISFLRPADILSIKRRKENEDRRADREETKIFATYRDIRDPSGAS